MNKLVQEEKLIKLFQLSIKGDFLVWVDILKSEPHLWQKLKKKSAIYMRASKEIYMAAIDLTVDLSKGAGQFLIIPNRGSGTAGDVEIVLTKLNLK